MKTIINYGRVFARRTASKMIVAFGWTNWVGWRGNWFGCQLLLQSRVRAKVLSTSMSWTRLQEGYAIAPLLIVLSLINRSMVVSVQLKSLTRSASNLLLIPMYNFSSKSGSTIGRVQVFWIQSKTPTHVHSETVVTRWKDEPWLRAAAIMVSWSGSTSHSRIGWKCLCLSREKCRLRWTIISYLRLHFKGTPFLGPRAWGPQVVSCMNLQRHAGLQARSILSSHIIKT
jgi:hypothetical protein